MRRIVDSLAVAKRGRKGTIQPWRDAQGRQRYRARVHLADGSRPWVPLDAGISEAMAREIAAHIQEKEDADGALLSAKREASRVVAAEHAKADDQERADAWFVRYLPTINCGENHRGKIEDQWRKWIKPLIGHKAMRLLTSDDIEDVRDALDRAIDAGKLRSKSAKNIWSIVTGAMQASYKGRVRSLRVHDAPLHFGILPPKSLDDARTRPWLYPNEWLKLARCNDVPIDRRRVYAVALYTGVRPNEHRVLTMPDVDVTARIVDVSKSWDEETRTVGPPKTREGFRSIPIEPTLQPLLEEMTSGRDKDELLSPGLSRREDRWAQQLRDDLRTAGVTRARLSADNAIMAYVEACKEQFPLLAADLRRRAAGEKVDELSRAGHSVSDGQENHDEEVSVLQSSTMSGPAHDHVQSVQCESAAVGAREERRIRLHKDGVGGSASPTLRESSGVSRPSEVLCNNLITMHLGQRVLCVLPKGHEPGYCSDRRPSAKQHGDVPSVSEEQEKENAEHTTRTDEANQDDGGRVGAQLKRPGNHGARVAELENVIRTGGAMYRAERVLLGCGMGGHDPEQHARDTASVSTGRYRCSNGCPEFDAEVPDPNGTNQDVACPKCFDVETSQIGYASRETRPSEATLCGFEPPKHTLTSCQYCEPIAIANIVVQVNESMPSGSRDERRRLAAKLSRGHYSPAKIFSALEGPDTPRPNDAPPTDEVTKLRNDNEALRAIAVAASDMHRWVTKHGHIDSHAHNRSETGCAECRVLNAVQESLAFWGTVPQPPEAEFHAAADEIALLIANEDYTVEVREAMLTLERRFRMGPVRPAPRVDKTSVWSCDSCNAENEIWRANCERCLKNRPERGTDYPLFAELWKCQRCTFCSAHVEALAAHRSDSAMSALERQEVKPEEQRRREGEAAVDLFRRAGEARSDSAKVAPPKPNINGHVPMAQCPRCGAYCDCPRDLTPCDRPYADCTVCKGTGKHDADPCPSCVWRRWAEDNRDSLKTPEELLAERAEEHRSETATSDPRLDVLEAAERICRELAEEYALGGQDRQEGAVDECADRIAAFANSFRTTPTGSTPREP